MSTATVPSAVLPESAESILLEGIRWRTYESLLRDFERTGSNLRMTYDRGRLEIMAPAYAHDRPKHLIGRMVEAMTEELNIPIAGGGSTTFRRQLKKRGLEPDECYWVQNEPRVRGKRSIDLDQCPPPDLAIEIENTRRLIERMPIYADLGFPEVWRYDGHAIRVALLQPNEKYTWGDRSACFPWLLPGELARFPDQATTVDETTWIRSFRAWVRAEVVP